MSVNLLLEIIFVTVFNTCASSEDLDELYGVDKD